MEKRVRRSDIVDNSLIVKLYDDRKYDAGKRTGLPVRWGAMSARDKNIRYYGNVRAYVKDTFANIRRLPIRPGQDIDTSISRSATQCNMADLSFDKVRPALEAAGLYTNPEKKLHFSIYYTNDKVENIKYDQDLFNEYVKHKNTLLYVTLSYTNDELQRSHIIGGIMIMNDVNLYIFMFGSFTEIGYRRRIIYDSMQYILRRQSFNTAFVLYPDLYLDVSGQTPKNIYSIQHRDPLYKTKGECQEFSVLIPILMARNLKADFEVLYGLPRARPQVLLNTISSLVKLIYDQYNLISLQNYNEVRRQVGLLGGASITMSKSKSKSKSPQRKKAKPKSKSRSRPRSVSRPKSRPRS